MPLALCGRCHYIWLYAHVVKCLHYSFHAVQMFVNNWPVDTSSLSLSFLCVIIQSWFTILGCQCNVFRQHRAQKAAWLCHLLPRCCLCRSSAVLGSCSRQSSQRQRNPWWPSAIKLLGEFFACEFLSTVPFYVFLQSRTHQFNFPVFPLAGNMNCHLC